MLFIEILTRCETPLHSAKQFCTFVVRPLVFNPFVIAWPHFSMLSCPGVIRVGAPLDYEKTNHYNLLIEALDTTTGNTAHVNVYIDIIVSSDPFCLHNRSVSLIDIQLTSHSDISGITSFSLFRMINGSMNNVQWISVGLRTSLPFKILFSTSVCFAIGEIETLLPWVSFHSYGFRDILTYFISVSCCLSTKNNQSLRLLYSRVHFLCDTVGLYRIINEWTVWEGMNNLGGIAIPFCQWYFLYWEFYVAVKLASGCSEYCTYWF